MKKFSIIGVGGFVAKKHIDCIKNLKGKLISACDINDNVGFLDKNFPKTLFFKKEKDFFNYNRLKKVDFIVICTPSYLHFQQIKKSLEAECNVIVEKPPVLNHLDLKKIYSLEKKHKKKCYCIFQLRLNKKLMFLKKKIIKKPKLFINKKISIDYYTYRGDWYFKTWKNLKNLSGGLLVNIGIHFFDILIWLFGDIKNINFKKKNNEFSSGDLEFNYAKVSWNLSLKRNNMSIKNKKTKFLRRMIVGKHIFQFDKFNDLHEKNYLSIINNKKFHISQFESTIKILSNISK